MPKIGFLGFGEAGQAMAEGLDQDFIAFDLRADRCRDTTSAQDLRQADLVFALVTADQALAAAKSAEGVSIYLDGNSCAPQTKQAAAEVIEAAGGTYIDLAIMAPIYPRKHQTPMLACGPQAEAITDQLTTLGMDVTFKGVQVGKASSIKLCRSIAVKGLEAMQAELSFAAHALDVADEVFDSLDASYPGFDWRRRSTYALDRMMVHGQRRAAEMAEAATMISGLGIDPKIAKATTQWQETVGSLGIAPGTTGFSERTGLLRQALGERA